MCSFIYSDLYIRFIYSDIDIHLFIRTPIGLVPCLNFLSCLAIHISLLFIRDLFVDLYVGALVTPHCVTKKVRNPPPPHPPPTIHLFVTKHYPTVYTIQIGRGEGRNW